MKTFTVMLVDQFIQVKAETDEAAMAEALRQIKEGEEQLTMIAWPEGSD